MAGEAAFTASAEKALRDVKQLIAEGQFAEASRMCLRAIRVHGGVNAFYRAKCYCDLQLSRWHSCLETVGWLHLFVEHPSLVEQSHQRCPKRMRLAARERRAEQHADRLEVVRGAVGAHIVNGECMWLHFEQAYSYYKLGHFERALSALRLCGANERPCDLQRSTKGNGPSADATTAADVRLNDALLPKYRFLLAQVYVRLGRFASARLIYSSAQTSKEDSLVALNSLSTDLNLAADLDQTARAALFASIDRDIEAKAGSEEALSYEHAYNWAIAKLLEGDFASAEAHLDVSEERLYAELQNDLGESSSAGGQPEFAALGALRVFLLHQRGCGELARSRNDALMASFDDHEGIDPAVLLIIRNNCLCLRGPEDGVAELIAKLEVLLKRDNVVCKFTPRELVAVHGNVLIRLLVAGDTASCRRHVMRFMDRLRQDESLHNTLACAEYIEGKVDGSISALKRGLAAHPGSVRLKLSLIRLLISARRFKSALRTAQAFEAALLSNGEAVFYWSALLQCYVQLGNLRGVVDVLSRLADCPHSPATAAALWRGCRFLESHGRHEEALRVYRCLLERDPESAPVLCGVLFNESFLPGAAGGRSHPLPAAVSESLFQGLRFIDPEELEAEGQVRFVPQAVEVRKSVKSRKRRRVRAPKVDTTRGTPDPERWLPKYQRAAFKKLLKRKKDMTKGHTQGSTADSASTKPSSGTIHTDSASVRCVFRPRSLDLSSGVAATRRSDRIMLRLAFGGAHLGFTVACTTACCGAVAMT
ncbi:signal recognition particle 72 kDa protein [Babesia caballi]|uniref:Signal recognition particle subunit SRP72 n=1 Tax=Babesia caballi TaxID=5871 RepID=A0AAV4M0Z9_BABCB|nr:signal recognition particle 72 kDa protein [Babesia caballi]